MWRKKKGLFAVIGYDIARWQLLSFAVTTDLVKTFCGRLYMQVLLTKHMLVTERMSLMLSTS